MPDQPESSPDANYLNMWTILILVGAVGFIFLIVIPNIEDAHRDVCPQFKERIQSDIQIYSVKDGTAIDGHFILGSGYIRTNLVYYFYTGDDTNGFQRQMLDSPNVYVFRDSDVAHLIKKTKFKMTTMDALTGLKGCLPNEIYELHVPKDTLIVEM
jgi:hypothetical protein